MRSLKHLVTAATVPLAFTTDERAVNYKSPR